MSENLLCNICGDKNYTVVFPEKAAQFHQIVKCATCGLMYAHPRKTVDEDSLLRLDPEWLMEHLHQRAWLQQRFQKERLQVRDYRDTLGFLKDYFPHTGKLVEVGSSFGFLCDFFRKAGWVVTGIDPNRGVCRYAESALRLNIIPSFLEKAAIPPESADVVLMMHILEHLADPKGILCFIHKILKPGGILVLETPCYDTWMFKWLGKRERSISCDSHVYFFTSATLKEIARRSGFEVIKQDHVGRSLTFDRILHNLGIVSKNKTVADWLGRLSRSLQLHRVWIYLNLRDMQRIYLRK